MYSLESLKEAITRLYHDGIDRGWYEDRVEDLLDSIDFGLMLQYVRDGAETVYAYTIQGDHFKSFNYRGADLFGQRASHLLTDYVQEIVDGVEINRNYELWLLEDMSLAVVSCVEMEDKDAGYKTCYRTVKDCNPWDSGMDIDLEVLTGMTDDMCELVTEGLQPVYEL